VASPEAEALFARCLPESELEPSVESAESRHHPAVGDSVQSVVLDNHHLHNIEADASTPSIVEEFLSSSEESLRCQETAPGLEEEEPLSWYLETCFDSSAEDSEPPAEDLESLDPPMSKSDSLPATLEDCCTADPEADDPDGEPPVPTLPVSPEPTESLDPRRLFPTSTSVESATVVNSISLPAPIVLEGPSFFHAEVVTLPCDVPELPPELPKDGALDAEMSASIHEASRPVSEPPADPPTSSESCEELSVSSMTPTEPEPLLTVFEGGTPDALLSSLEDLVASLEVTPSFEEMSPVLSLSCPTVASPSPDLLLLSPPPVSSGDDDNIMVVSNFS